jgi:myosin heavy subunit
LLDCWLAGWLAGRVAGWRAGGLAGAAAGAPAAAAKKPGPAARGKKVAFLSVGSQFRAQLVELMGTLSDTNPYFIRCIKPNTEKVSDHFDSHMVISKHKYF